MYVTTWENKCTNIDLYMQKAEDISRNKYPIFPVIGREFFASEVEGSFYRKGLGDFKKMCMPNPPRLSTAPKKQVAIFLPYCHI